MDELLVIQLWGVFDAFEGRLERELKKMDLTIAGFRLIGEVMREPDGVRQSELAKRLRVRAPTVSAAVTRLEERGLLQRCSDPDDPRAWRVKLAAGAPLKPGTDLLRTIDGDIAESLSERDQKQLGRLLKKVSAAMPQDLERP